MNERFEDRWQRFWRDGATQVPDGHTDAVCVAMRCERDGGTMKSMLDGVVEEVRQHLLETLAIRLKDKVSDEIGHELLVRNGCP